MERDECHTFLGVIFWFITAGATKKAKEVVWLKKKEKKRNLRRKKEIYERR